jgi:ubiquinone/menaquinone biosynthesis C-methylase UbiE
MTKPDHPYRRNSLLRLSYSLIAPLYDFLIDRPMREARKRSLAVLPSNESKFVLVSGVGTGLDLPLLPKFHRYTALDFNAAMLAHAVPRGAGLEIDFVLGDSMWLPFADARFDYVVLHLIVVVVHEPQRCLSEALRVLKPGGTIILFDKFLHARQRAPLRRLFSGITRHFATRMDVVLEELLLDTPQLEVVSDVPLLGNGWFRGILLRKKPDDANRLAYK